MAKKGKKGKSSNEETIDNAIEKDERFAGIMKDPVEFDFERNDNIEISYYSFKKGKYGTG